MPVVSADFTLSVGCFTAGTVEHALDLVKSRFRAPPVFTVMAVSVPGISKVIGTAVQLILLPILAEPMLDCATTCGATAANSANATHIKVETQKNRVTLFSTLEEKKN